MAFRLTPGMLGFKLGDVLVGLKEGTEDTPEALKMTEGRAHTLSYLWNTSTLAWEVETTIRSVAITSPIATATPLISDPGVAVRPVRDSDKDFIGRQSFNTLFGEKVTGMRTDDVSVMFQYGNSTYETTATVTGSGSTSNADGRAGISVTGAIGSANLSSKAPLRYRPGHEALAQFTTVYTGAQVGVSQYHGLLNTVDGAAFGTKDGVFGCWLLEGGVEVFYPRSAFLADKLDGTGPSGFVLDPTKINIYMVQFGWLGIAPILYSVYTGVEYGWVLAHYIDRVNAATTPHLDNPSLPIAARCVRAAIAGTDAAIYTSSWRAGVVAGPAMGDEGRWFANTVLDATIAPSGVRNNIFTLRSKTTFQGHVNHVAAELAVLSLDNAGNKAIAVYIRKDGVLTGNSAYTDIDATNSVMEVSTGGTIAGGRELGSAVLKAAGDRRTDILNTGLVIYPGEMATVEIVTSGAFSGTVSASVRWVERF